MNPLSRTLVRGVFLVEGHAIRQVKVQQLRGYLARLRVRSYRTRFFNRQSKRK